MAEPNGNGNHGPVTAFNPRAGQEMLDEAFPIAQLDPMGGQGSGLVIRSMNTNMGAVRVGMPRNEGLILRKIASLAQVLGDDWEYSIPFFDKKKGREVFVTGPTVGCATAVARAFGNCSISCDLTSESPAAWVFGAIFNDIEAGFWLSRSFRQRREPNIGGYKGDKARAEDIAFQIAVSKGTRNVINNALKDFMQMALLEARRSMTKKVTEKPAEAIAYIREIIERHDIPERRVSRFFGNTLEKLQHSRLAVIARMCRSLEDDLIDADDFCPESSQPGAGSIAPEVKETDQTSAFREDKEDVETKAQTTTAKPATTKPASAKPASAKPASAQASPESKPANTAATTDAAAKAALAAKLAAFDKEQADAAAKAAAARATLLAGLEPLDVGNRGSTPVLTDEDEGGGYGDTAYDDADRGETGNTPHDEDGVVIEDEREPAKPVSAQQAAPADPEAKSTGRRRTGGGGLFKAT